MTRINIGIKPRECCDSHLIAAVNEGTHILGHAKRYAKAKKPTPLPEMPTLNAGHCRYFYDKGLWLWLYAQTYIGEMVLRGIKSDIFTARWRRFIHEYPKELLGSGQLPDGHEEYGRAILIVRMRERLENLKVHPKWTNRDIPAWAEGAMTYRTIVQPDQRERK